MDRLLQIVPESRDRMYRNRGKIAGFFAGAAGALAMGMFASVWATGHPIDLGPPPPVQVYTNF